MKNGNRANALLMELLIVILFFMFAATTLVEIFGMARQRSRRAESAAAALLEAQNAAETLYDAEDPVLWLRENGFSEQDGAWILDSGEYLLRVTEQTEETEAGWLRTVNVGAEIEGESLFTLPSVRYTEKEASP